MKSVFLGFKRVFPSFQRRNFNQNNLLFRAFGATLFSFLNYKYFSSHNAVVEEKIKKEFGLKTQTPSANF